MTQNYRVFKMTASCRLTTAVILFNLIGELRGDSYYR